MIDLALRRSHLRAPGTDVAIMNALTAGSQIDMSMTIASKLTLVLLDPLGVIAGTPIARDGQAIEWGPIDFTVAGVRHGPVNGVRCTTISAYDKGVVALKGREGAKSWSGMSPTAVVASECAAVGMRLVAQPTAPRKVISRLGKAKDRPATNSWALFQSLASESGFIVTAVAGVCYFGAPSWLVKRPGWVLSATGQYMAAYPDIERSSLDPDTPGTGTLSIFGEQPAGVLLPCLPVQLDDVVKPLRGRYLVESATISLASPLPVTVTITTPVDPKKQQAAT